MKVISNNAIAAHGRRCGLPTRFVEALARWAAQWLCCGAVFAQAGCGEVPNASGVIVAKDPLEVPPPITRTDATTVHVELVATEMTAELGAGWIAHAWTFGGTIPGPLIRVMEGDTVVVHLTNASGNTEPHSIDLHAMIGYGGGADESELLPGQSVELQFQAEHQGVFLYHCAAEGMPWEHVAHGMYGAILVEPRGGLPAVDTEIYVAQSEWYLEAKEQKSVSDFDEGAARASHPSFFTFNGHRQALSSPDLFGDRIHVPQGGRARIIFANAGPNLQSSLHVVGDIFDDVYAGTFDTAARNLQTVGVPPGSAAVFELGLPIAGAYDLVDHALYHAERGALGVLRADPPP